MVKVRIDEEIVVGGGPNGVPGRFCEVGAVVEVDDDIAQTLVEHRMATVVGGSITPQPDVEHADPEPIS